MGEDNVSAPSSFIANAHNELYAFYAGKHGLFSAVAAREVSTPPAGDVTPKTF